MSALLITDIAILAGIHPKSITMLKGKAMADLPSLKNAWLLCKDGLIADFGTMDNLSPERSFSAINISAKEGLVFPAWCDSHTHTVFASSREEEFVMKIRGESYEMIAAAGGGILNSARKLQRASDHELFEHASLRLNDMIRQGTGAVEIKSGYGLTLESEIKMLQVIRRLKEAFPIPVKASFLGAHAFPQEYQNNRNGYIRLIIEEMLPKIAGDGLADYIDVFCEHGFFSLAETDKILEAGAKYGLPPKIHANQLSASGAAQLGVKHNAVSVDHLEVTDQAVINSIARSNTIATLLPSCSFYLNIPYANARGMIQANLPIALASDFNPGSSPSGNMNFVVSLGCIKLKMLPEEVINAATLNGAAAMQLSGETGSITIGKKANLFITKPMPSVAYLPYSFGQSQVEKVIINGKVY